MRRRLNATNIMFDYVDPQIYRDSIKFLNKYNVQCFPDAIGYIRITLKDSFHQFLVISPSKGSELFMRPEWRIVKSRLERFILPLKEEIPFEPRYERRNTDIIDLPLKEGGTIKEGRRTFQIYLKTPLPIYEDDHDHYYISKVKSKK